MAEPNSFSKSPESSPESDSWESLPEGHWFRIIEKLAKESGKIPDPLEIRATALISALGLPSGETSALEVNKQGKRINPEKDRIMAEYLTDKPGIQDKETGIVSTDFRDMYPEGLPEELKSALDSRTREIMETEYKHAEHTKKEFWDTRKRLEADRPIHYFRLPGGIDLFLRGYVHNKIWQKRHGAFLKKMNKYAEVICIEGFPDRSLGDSLDIHWSNLEEQNSDYDALMHEAVDAGFKGFFTEVDARDVSKIRMDHSAFLFSSILPDFPYSFFQKFFEFFQSEHPKLAEKIGSPENLQQVLIKQSITTDRGLFAPYRNKEIYRHGRAYTNYPYLTQKGKDSLEPTFLELGQFLFTDALAALKLQLIAKLMADGYLPKGPIIDYEGTCHLSSKSFFLRYPDYAAQVVLRTVNELMAGKVKKKGNIQEIYRVFENPDWTEIVKEIVRLPFKTVEDDPSKITALGPNQKKLIDYPVDFLKIYQIDPEKVMPTDKEIQKIREKIASRFP